MSKGIILEGKEAYEVFQKWASSNFVTMVNEMIQHWGIDKTIETMKKLYKEKHPGVEDEFIQTMRNAFQYIIDNQSKNN